MVTMTTKHVMLSYQWDSQVLVKRVYNRLCFHGYNVWMDIEGGVDGDINECMAYGVENSAAIVCFLCEKYEASLNCKRELSYADRIGVTIIPVIVQSHRSNGNTFNPAGWLGILTASLHYISLTDSDSEETFQTAIQSLSGKLEKVSVEKKCRIYARQGSPPSQIPTTVSSCPAIQLPELTTDSPEPNLDNPEPGETPSSPPLALEDCDSETERDLHVAPPIIVEVDGQFGDLNEPCITYQPRDGDVNEPTIPGHITSSPSYEGRNSLYPDLSSEFDTTFRLVTDPIEAEFAVDDTSDAQVRSVESPYEVVSRTVKETARKLSPRLWRKSYVA